MEIKANIMDDTAVARALKRVSHEIIERNDSLKNVVLIGIKSRGIPLAGIIAENVKKYEGVSLDVGELDISLYRDDLAEKSETPVIEKINVPFEVRGRDVVLVDDVLFTGRTARAQSTPCSRWDVRARYNLPCLSTAVIANFRYARTTSAKTCQRPSRRS